MLDRLIRKRIQTTRKSVLLLGPRQVGKSTLCQTLQPDLAINLADEETFLLYAKDPARLKREVLALKRSGIVLIDEVQRIPSLLNTVQALLDAPTPGRGPVHRFLLTGSSARKLKRGGANLLPGRMYWSIWTRSRCLRPAASSAWICALQTGMLPGIFLQSSSEHPEEREEAVRTLATYAEVYLREEIRFEALTRNLAGLCAIPRYRRRCQRAVDQLLKTRFRR